MDEAIECNIKFKRYCHPELVEGQFQRNADSVVRETRTMAVNRYQPEPVDACRSDDQSDFVVRETRTMAVDCRGEE